VGAGGPARARDDGGAPCRLGQPQRVETGHALVDV
jgi:hypothetical protein